MNNESTQLKEKRKGLGNIMSERDSFLFYKQFEKALIANNLKYTPFLRSLGISASLAKRWQEGALINVYTLVRLANALNVSTDYFFEDIDYQTAKSRYISSTEICDKPTNIVVFSVKCPNCKRWFDGKNKEEVVNEQSETNSDIYDMVRCPVCRNNQFKLFINKEHTIIYEKSEQKITE